MQSIAVMLGAGASKDANLPDVKELVSSFLLDSGVGERPLLQSIYEALSAEREIVDVELLLDALDQLGRRTEQVLSAFVEPTGWSTAATATPAAYRELLEALYGHIRDRLSVDSAAVAYYGTLIDLAVIQGGMDIFSLNYDLAVELACLERREPWTDGFDPQWNPEQFVARHALRRDEPRFRIRLHKMHGSLLWHRLENGTIEKVAVSPSRSRDVLHFSGSRLEEALIYPAAGGKDVSSEPFATLVERFRSVLRGVDSLVAVGYSFRDRHIKSVITEALALNPRLRLVVLDPAATAVLRASDATTPTRIRFAHVASQIQPLPAGARDAFISGELRDLLSRLVDLRNAEDDLQDARRRLPPAQVQNAAAELATVSRKVPNAVALCEMLRPGSGDFDAARIATVGSKPQDPTTIFDKIVLAAGASEPVRQVAEQAVREAVRSFCAGVFLGLETGLHVARIVWPGPRDPDAVPHLDTTIYAAWHTNRIAAIDAALTALSTSFDYASFHLGDTYADARALADRFRSDLDDARHFFDLCAAWGGGMVLNSVGARRPSTGAEVRLWYPQEAMDFGTSLEARPHLWD